MMKYTINNLPKKFEFRHERADNTVYSAIVKEDKTLDVVWDCGELLGHYFVFTAIENLNKGIWTFIEEAPKFQEMKIKIVGDSHLVTVLEGLCKAGYKGTMRLYHNSIGGDCRYVYTYTSGSVGWASNEKFSTEHPLYDYDKYSNSFKQVKETVEILGVQVDKEKAVKFLESLQ